MRYSKISDLFGPYEIFDANQNLHSILSTFVYLLNARSVKLNKINNDLDVLKKKQQQRIIHFG